MDKLSLILKYVAGLFLIGMLGFFVDLGKVPADVLEVAVFAGLAAIGVHAVGKYGSASGDGGSVDPKQGGFVQPYLLAVLGAISCMCLIAACATTSTTTSNDTTVTTPDLTKVCSYTQIALTVASTVATAYDATAAATLSAASTVVADTCTAGSTIDAATLGTLANKTLPDLVALINATGAISSADRQKATAALAIAQAAIAVINADIEKTATPEVKAALAAPHKGR